MSARSNAKAKPFAFVTRSFLFSTVKGYYNNNTVYVIITLSENENII